MSDHKATAVEAARRATIDGEALCKALGINSRGEEAPVEVFRFVAERFVWHYNQQIADATKK